MVSYGTGIQSITSSIVHGVLVGAGSLANIEAPIWSQVDIDHGVKRIIELVVVHPFTKGWTMDSMKWTIYINHA